MNNEQIRSLSINTLGREIRNDNLSVEQIVGAYLDRIRAVNPALNAVVRLLDEEALESARMADKTIADGQELPPLCGVPMTIKDVFDMRGLPTCAGLQSRLSHSAPEDASIVGRLRRAGAIFLAKTNVPELSMGFETANREWGRTNNPFDLNRSPGGSSGGEAALIAAGASCIGIGTDAAGSVRIPAHFCGLVGLRPTLGRVSRHGTFPPFEGAAGDVFTPGVLGRTVADVQALYRVIEGPDGLDPHLSPVSGTFESSELPAIRVAVYDDNGVRTPDPEIRQVIRKAAESLGARGLKVEEARPTGLDRAFPIFTSIFMADSGDGLTNAMAGLEITDPHPVLKSLHAFLSSGPNIPSSALLAALQEWDSLRWSTLRFMSSYDVMLCPVYPTAARLHDAEVGSANVIEEGLLNTTYAIFPALLGYPSLSIPFGESEAGLPIGVQLIGRPWAEDLLFRTASLLEQSTEPWHAVEPRSNL